VYKQKRKFYHRLAINANTLYELAYLPLAVFFQDRSAHFNDNVSHVLTDEIATLVVELSNGTSGSRPPTVERGVDVISLWLD
jgi:hypothetical protein